MQSKSFHIFQIDDPAEAERVVTSLRAIPGVKMATGDHETKIFAVQWSDPAEWEDIEKTLRTLDYVPEIH